VEFHVLGSVEIHVGGKVIHPGPPQQQLTLAVLLAEAGRTISTETLIDRIWDEAPATARRAAQVYISRLRRVLQKTAGEPVQVRNRSGGYLLDIAADRVDLHRCRRLTALARDPACPAGERATLLGSAVELWRGQPLTGIPGRWAARTREAWQQEYVDSAVAWARAELCVANPTAVIGRLSEAAAEYPLTESLAGALMRAMYAAGRPADALDQYGKISRRLAEELGVDPGRDLRELHRAILRDEPAGTRFAGRVTYRRARLLNRRGCTSPGRCCARPRS